MENKVMHLLKQFDILLSQMACLSLDELRLIITEISQKIDVLRAEIADVGEDSHNSPTASPLFIEYDGTTYDEVGEKQEIVVLLDADSLKIEDCEEANSGIGSDAESQADINCLYVLSQPGEEGVSGERTVACKVILDNYGESSRDSSENGESMPVLDDRDRVSDSEVESLGNMEDDDLLGSSARTCVTTSCTECGEELGTKRAYVAHMTDTHPEQLASLHACRLCGKNFRSANGLKYHSETRHQEKNAQLGEQYRCERPDCDYRTGSRVLLRVHRYSHTVNAPLTCPVCNKNFLGGTKALEQHLKIHTNSRDYQCRLCSKSFVNQSRLTFHMGNVHEAPRFQCDQCSKTFRAKANFERHLRIHTDDKPFVCRICGFRCNHSTNLSSHVRTIHKDATFTAGKAAKDAKRNSLLKEILAANRPAQPDSGDALAVAGKLKGLSGETDAAQWPVSLGRVVLKRLESQGKVVTVGGTPPPPRVPAAVVPPTKRFPSRGRQNQEKSLVRRQKLNDRIFTVTNSRGDLVEALLTIDSIDADGCL